MKPLVFKRTMMQRYRAIANIADSIIANGYELFIEVQSDDFDLNSIRKNPMDASQASRKSFIYLIDNFGISCKNIDKINFTTKKNKVDGLFLLIDDKKNSKDFVSIPYNGFVCSDGKNDKVVGNPMCELIKKRQNDIMEEKNTLLLIHPGGGRGYISPVRQNMKKEKVIKNNIRFLKKILSNIPNTIEKITIKTHPVSYMYCDKKSMEKHVLTVLRNCFADFNIDIIDDDLAGNIAKHEYILNIGSTSAIWLLGSCKKWINVFGLAKYEYDKHRDHRKRASDWFKWPQNIKLKKLHETISNYNSCVLSSQFVLDVRDNYKKMYDMDSTSNIINFINDRS